LEFALLSRQEMDIADAAQVAATIEREKPWAIINAAGFVRVADAAREHQRCLRENAQGPENLARVCAAHGIPFLTFSSDLVFDGRLGRAYEESDPTCPTCEYGRSKARAEARVLEQHRSALIVRTSAFFGPWDEYNFVHRTIVSLSEHHRITLDANTVVSPTYLPDLADAVLDLLVDGEHGIWHLSNLGSGSWYELGRQVAERAGCRSSLIQPGHGEPRNTALTSRRGRLMPTFEDALDRFFKERERESRLPLSEVSEAERVPV